MQVAREAIQDKHAAHVTAPPTDDVDSECATPSAEELYREGRVHKAQEDIAVAERFYRAALAIEPGYVDAWISLGVLLRGRGLFADAERCQREALRHDPTSVAAQTNLGNVLFDCGQLDDAA